MELGDCFRTAYRTFMELNYDGNYRLVHAMIDGQGPVKGLRFVHAWVEDLDNQVVIDNTLPEDRRILPIRFYYHIAHVDLKELEGYSMDQVLDYSIKDQTYGPWNDKFNKIIYLK